MRVSSAFLSVLLFIGFSAQAPASNAQSAPWSCPGNIVKNGGFNSNTVIIGDGSMPPSSTAFWTAAYGTPQLQSGAGCHDPDYVSFWGNKVVGEAIQQPVTFVAGRTYSIEFCGRFHPDPNKPLSTFVTIALRASTGPLTDPSCPTGTCETVMTTSNIASTSWGTFKGCFTAAHNESLLTISPSNGSSINDGAQVSFGQIDNICIREVQPPVIDGPSDTCTKPSTYCVKPPATGPFTWSVPGTFVPVTADGSCIAVTWASNSGGSIQVTSNVNGCPMASNFIVHACPHPICCDSISPTLVTSESYGDATLTVAMNAGGQQATLVKATVLGAWHTFPSGCGMPSPITATAAWTSTQPPSPTGWNPASVPFLHGNQIVWSSSGHALGPAPFAMTFDLSPGTGSFNCNDSITMVIEFEANFSGTPTQPCRTCTAIRQFTFGRCPSCR